jgi:capsule polysaccharide export protein KpsE/RkpR
MLAKIEETSRELKTLEDEIRLFQEKYGVFSMEQLVETQTVIMNDLQAQLVQAEVAIRNYTVLSSQESLELRQLQAQRDSILTLIRQVENGQGFGSIRMPGKDEMPAIAIEYSHKKVAHEIQMNIFQNLQEQYELKKLSSTDASVFSILEPPEIPEKKAGPGRGIICIVSTIVGFMMGLLTGILKEFVLVVLDDLKKKKIPFVD